MIRNPKVLLITCLAVTVVCFVLAGLIGQHNDGPWGGLPEWLGSVAWFGFLLGVLATVASGLWWGVRSGRRRATP